ncbi:MAG TPA: D-glycerate dehydrogenase [Acidimicrobiales bacterium]
MAGRAPHRVLVTRQLPTGGLDPLVEAGHEIVQRPDDVPFTPDQLRRAASEVDAIISVLTDQIDATVIAAAPKLRVVANVAVGYDNIDLEAARRAGVAVCNTPGVLDETTADLAFALILAAARLLGAAERDLRAGRWTGWGISQYLGHDVHGATLGVVGYGRIGRAVARRGEAFGMRVLHHSRRPSGTPGYVGDLDELLRQSDVVSLHLPLDDGTRGLVDHRRLAAMKPTAVLVNTSRGPVVDEEALAVALEEGRIFAAGLDVFEHEPAVHPRLLAAPRVVLTPHIGSASVATRTKMARMAAEGVRAALAGEVPHNLVGEGPR